jgi:DNA-binding NtrC family response regulator
MSPPPPTAGPAFDPYHGTRAEAVLRKSHILVVDDEEYFRSALERILARVGHHVHGARNATEALEQVAAEPIELVLVDVQMPGINGLELVRQIHDVAPDLPCIVMTGHGGLEMSTEALQAGAFWYLDKASDMSKMAPIRRLVESAIELGHLKSENRRLQSELRRKYRFENIVGSSRALRSVLDVVGKVADTDSTVLVTGESGTGKELIARALHYNSGRSDRTFVTVNCGAIPGELLESELFGHVKGAFTNAVNHREGRFSLANGGTIFLDEIGEIDVSLQAKLLRVLQDRVFERAGGSSTRAMKARVLAATNRDLPAAVAAGAFRADLMYRLAVVELVVPPLRDRRADFGALVAEARAALERRGAPPLPELEPAALAELERHTWPGNVRELLNVLERLALFCQKTRVGRADVEQAIGGGARPGRIPELACPPSPEHPGAVERILSECHGNVARAARRLGVPRSTLRYRLARVSRLARPVGASGAAEQLTLPGLERVSSC